MSNIVGATWKGTYSKYASYFRVFCNYTWEPNYSTTQARLIISSVGIQRTSGNSAAEMVSGAAKSATVNLTGAASGGGSQTFDKESTAYSWAESSTAEKSFGSKTYTINKEGTVKTLTFTVSAKKNSGAWSGSSSKSITLSMPAKSDESVQYDKNTTDTVSNMPSTQTKGSGYSITLSTLVPVRSGYTFIGWANNSTTANASFDPGDTYNNSSTTLYAVWFKEPKISNIKAFRTSQTGVVNPSVDNDSANGFCIFTYTNAEGVSSQSATIKFGSSSSRIEIPVSSSGSSRYAYSKTDANNICPLMERTPIAIKITITNKAKTPKTITYNYSSFISAKAFAFDIFKPSGGNFINIGMGKLASESAGSRQTIDMDSEVYIFLPSGSQIGIDGELNTAITNLSWTNDVMEDR